MLLCLAASLRLAPPGARMAPAVMQLKDGPPGFYRGPQGGPPNKRVEEGGGYGDRYGERRGGYLPREERRGPPPMMDRRGPPPMDRGYGPPMDRGFGYGPPPGAGYGGDSVYQQPDRRNLGGVARASTTTGPVGYSGSEYGERSQMGPGVGSGVYRSGGMGNPYRESLRKEGNRIPYSEMAAMGARGYGGSGDPYQEGRGPTMMDRPPPREYQQGGGGGPPSSRERIYLGGTRRDELLGRPVYGQGYQGESRGGRGGYGPPASEPRGGYGMGGSGMGGGAMYEKGPDGRYGRPNYEIGDGSGFSSRGGAPPSPRAGAQYQPQRGYDDPFAAAGYPGVSGQPRGSRDGGNEWSYGQTDAYSQAPISGRPSATDRARARAYKTGSGPPGGQYRSGPPGGQYRGGPPPQYQGGQGQGGQGQGRGPQMGPMGNNNNNSPQQPPVKSSLGKMSDVMERAGDAVARPIREQTLRADVSRLEEKIRLAKKDFGPRMYDAMARGQRTQETRAFEETRNRIEDMIREIEDKKDEIARLQREEF